MGIIRSWYSVAEAEEKFGIDRATILEWVAEGMVRSEEEDGEVVRVEVDDLELKVKQALYQEGLPG